jgi:Tfp pilus assembly protein PilF
MSLAVAGILLAACSSLVAQINKQEDNLRERALALNDVTGDDPIKGEIRALAEKPADTKKLLATAVKMSKEKEQPFNFNGAFILANAAFRLGDLEASQVLYNVCADQAAKLQSLRKLIQAYGGITAVLEQLYIEKKYDKSTQLSQQFLEMLERQGVKREFKERVLRHMIQSMFKQGKIDDATRMVDSLVKEHGDDWRNLKLKAWLDKEKGQPDQAAKTYTDVLGRIAEDKDLKKDKDEKQNEENQVYFNIMEIVEQLYVDKKYELSQKLSQQLLDTAEKHGSDQAIKSMVMRLMVPTMVRRGEIDQAKRTVEKLLKQAGNDWRNLKVKAWLAYETGRFDEAAKTYEGVLPRINQDSNLAPDDRIEEQRRIRYILSTVYVDLDRVDKAADQLKALLADEPNEPTYNNDLGYIWADHDQNLDEAERMIQKALDEDRKQRKQRIEEKRLKAEEDKDNPAYLDSMGWVLFKKKKFQEAKKYLIEASKDKDGQHIEILDHLGDTHLSLGEKTDAVAVWKKALQIKPASKREEQKKAQVEQKLKANQ